MKVNFNQIMEANVLYLKQLFSKDFKTQPTVEKREIMEVLDISISLMMENKYAVENIELYDNILFIFIKDDKGFIYRLYTGTSNKVGKIDPNSATLSSDFIHNEERRFDIETIINILYLTFKTSYLKNTPFRHGLAALPDIEGSDRELDLPDDTVDDLAQYHKGKNKTKKKEV